MLKKRGSRSALLAGVVALLAASAGGVAWATIPAADNAINGCYERYTGILRVIDAEAGKTCTKYELPITWNQRGPQGEAGVQGERGPVGPVGPQGPAGPGVDSLDDLGGLACTKAGSAGTTAITVGEDGVVSLRCESAAGGGGGGAGGSGIEQGDITLAPSPLAFGLVNVGASLELSVRVTNSRGSTIDEITAVSPSAAFEITNGCGSLAPAASCTIRIRFRPTQVRVYQETLLIGNQPYAVLGQGVS